MKAFFREFLITLILAVAIFFAVQASIETFVVIYTSMEPSFHDGQRLVVNKAIYHFRPPERGEVIIFQPPGNDKGDYIKRIIALPGDTVEIKDRAVYINDSALDEPYIMDSPNYTLDEQKIPVNSYFVLGDNRNNSDDSHHGWFVPRQNIIGKVWVSIWPPDNWGIVPDYPIKEQLTSFTNGKLPAENLLPGTARQVSMPLQALLFP